MIFMQMVDFQVEMTFRLYTICHYVFLPQWRLPNTTETGFYRVRFNKLHSFTFSIKHLRDVQELLSHIKGSVQVTNRVVLEAHRPDKNQLKS